MLRERLRVGPAPAVVRPITCARLGRAAPPGRAPCQANRKRHLNGLPCNASLRLRGQSFDRGIIIRQHRASGNAGWGGQHERLEVLPEGRQGDLARLN